MPYDLVQRQRRALAQMIADVRAAGGTGTNLVFGIAHAARDAGLMAGDTFNGAAVHVNARVGVKNIVVCDDQDWLRPSHLGEA